MQRGAKLRSAVHHQSKNGREFEGGALIGGEAAMPLSCFINKRIIVTDNDVTQQSIARGLDDYTAKKFRAFTDTHDHRGRKKGCGAWTVRGDSRDGKERRFIRLNCKCWDCRYCGPRRAKRYRHAVGIWAAKHGLNRFLTLTLDPQKLNGEDSTKYLRRTFGKLRSLLHREYGRALTYICVLEYQQNGNAHLHILLNRYVQIQWLRAKWQAVGGGWQVWIKLITIRSVVNYVSKYLSKDLLLSAPKGARRVTTSRDIRLFEKPSPEIAWSLVKTPIERIRSIFPTTLREIFCDSDGSLSEFAIVLNIA